MIDFNNAVNVASSSTLLDPIVGVVLSYLFTWATFARAKNDPGRLAVAVVWMMISLAIGLFALCLYFFVRDTPNHLWLAVTLFFLVAPATNFIRAFLRKLF